MTRQLGVERAAGLADFQPLLVEAIGYVGHPAIRSRGTIGGSLAHADPAAELPACAVALDAVIKVASTRGARSISARAFFKGLYETALAPDEIIIAVDIPKAALGTRVAFLELARRRGDYAMVGLAAVARMEGGALHAPRLVFFGVGVKPVDAMAAAAALGAGAPIDRIAAAQEALGEDLDPPGDVQADRATKLHLARVLLARGVQALAEGDA